MTQTELFDLIVAAAAIAGVQRLRCSPPCDHDECGALLIDDPTALPALRESLAAASLEFEVWAETAEQWPALDYSALPLEHLRDGLRRYVEQGIPTGGFLESVLSNDLRAAVSRADPYTRHNLARIVAWLESNMPPGVWGSTTAYKRWLTAHQAKREYRRGLEVGKLIKRLEQPFTFDEIRQALERARDVGLVTAEEFAAALELAREVARARVEARAQMS